LVDGILRKRPEFVLTAHCLVTVVWKLALEEVLPKFRGIVDTGSNGGLF